LRGLVLIESLIHLEARPMKLSLWMTALPAVQNGWNYCAFVVLIAVWLYLRRR
jgi:hypothetical protein